MAKQGKRDFAKEWLIDFLKFGPQEAGYALAIGPKRRTLKRAKKELGVRSIRRNGLWLWVLPAPAVVTNHSTIDKPNSGTIS